MASGNEKTKKENKYYEKNRIHRIICCNGSILNRLRQLCSG